MIAVFYGKDDFTAHEELEALRRELGGDPSAAGLADDTVRLDASVRPDDLLALCQTVPFLSAHRLVIVEGLLGRFETERRRTRRRRPAADLGPWEDAIAQLANLPETTVLVFIDGDLAAQNPFLQALRPLARVRECKPLAQNEVPAWITQRARGLGVSLEARAVAALALLVGNHLWTLDSELQKLAVYAGDRPVTEEDVRSLVSEARQPNVFAMCDAAVEGRARDAADLLQRLLADGMSPQYLLTMLSRQYRLLLRTKELLEQGLRPPEISARLQVPPFVAQRLLQQAPAYTVAKLTDAYRRLLEADLSVKRGIFDETTALQLLLAELTTDAKRTPARGSGRPRPARTPAGA